MNAVVMSAYWSFVSSRSAVFVVDDFDGSYRPRSRHKAGSVRGLSTVEYTCPSIVLFSARDAFEQSGDTHSSFEPVSTTTATFCPGVPIVTGQNWSAHLRRKRWGVLGAVIEALTVNSIAGRPEVWNIDVGSSSNVCSFSEQRIAGRSGYRNTDEARTDS